MLFPVYTTANTYKEKQYHVLINGQRGNVKGDYPKSPLKIAGIAAAVLLALLLLFLFREGGRRKAPMISETAEAVETVECAETIEEEEKQWDYSADSLPM